MLATYRPLTKCGMTEGGSSLPTSYYIVAPPPPNIRPPSSVPRLRKFVASPPWQQHRQQCRSHRPSTSAPSHSHSCLTRIHIGTMEQIPPSPPRLPLDIPPCRRLPLRSLIFPHRVLSAWIRQSSWYRSSNVECVSMMCMFAYLHVLSFSLTHKERKKKQYMQKK